MARKNPTSPSSYNIIVFGDPQADADRELVIEWAGGITNDSSSQDKSSTDPRVFEHTRYTIKPQVDTKPKSDSPQPGIFYLYDTVGLSESHGSSLDPQVALDNLYQLAYNLGGEVNLLVYVVRQLPTQQSMQNYQLFYEIFSQKKVPLVVVKTAGMIMNSGHEKPIIQHISLLPKDSPMPSDLGSIQSVTRDGIQPSKADVLQALQRNACSSEKSDPMEWFTKTASRSWNLLGREAVKGDDKWKLDRCDDALYTTLRERARLSPYDAKEMCREVKDYMKRHFFRNVILFGDSGVGKSSIINMLGGKPEAKSAPSMTAVTLENQPHYVEIKGDHYQVHDTVGFNKAPIVEEAKTMASLYKLVLEVHGGVGLLVYVIRGRINQTQVADYNLFYKVICQEKVPIVLIVTGLEELSEAELEEWWGENKPVFDTYGITFDGHACITATKGGHLGDNKYTYQTKYEASRGKVIQLLFEHTKEEGWKLEPTKWLKEVGTRAWNMFARPLNWKVKPLDDTVRDELIKLYGCKPQDAATATNTIFGRRHLFRSDSRQSD